MLEKKVRLLFDSPESGYSNDKKPLTGIKQLIQGKEAMFRAVMLAKRVNFSARTVINPDTSLRFGEISIPRTMAKDLTIRVRVCATNVAHCNKLMRERQVSFFKRKGDRTMRYVTHSLY